MEPTARDQSLPHGFGGMNGNLLRDDGARQRIERVVARLQDRRAGGADQPCKHGVGAKQCFARLVPVRDDLTAWFGHESGILPCLEGETQSQHTNGMELQLFIQ